MASSHKVFTAEEKQTLIELVSTHPYIEEKRTDVMSLARKRKAWEGIAAVFNAKAGVTKRTLDQLKKCWINMKARRKKELAEEARSRMGTGGGPPELDVESFPDIDAVAPHLSIHTGFRFDNDVAVIDGDNVVISLDEVAGTPSLEQSEEMEHPDESQNSIRRPNRVSPMPVSRHLALEKEVDVRMQRARNLQQQDKELFQLKLEEQRFLVEVAKEKLRMLEEEERRRRVTFEEEEKRKKVAFEAEERRKEELHAFQLSLMKK